MKKEITEFVAQCLTYQKVKAEHSRLVRPLQPLPILEWKQQYMTMNFVSSLPWTPKSNDFIWVIVDRLTKSAHFLPIKLASDQLQLAKVYVDEIIRLHGAPISVILNQDAKFTSRFWEGLQREMGTTVNFSMAFYPQTDGQSD